MATELPQDRVTAFIESHDEWEGAGEDYITGTGTYKSEGAVKLYKSDLRDVLNELEEHQRMLIEADTVLSTGLPAEAKVYALRTLLGNWENVVDEDTRPMLTPPGEGWVTLPAHVFVRGVCRFCDEDRETRTYEEYLTNFWTMEYEGDPNHVPMPENEWNYIHYSCNK